LTTQVKGTLDTVLGDYADLGFSLAESDGYVEVYLKDSKIKNLPQDEATQSKIREVCEQFLKRDKEIVRLLHKAGAERGLCDPEHRKLNRLIAEQEGEQ